MSRQGIQPRTSTYRPAQSSRSQYPSFLSVQDTLQLQLSCAWRGLLDAFRWDVVISTVTRWVGWYATSIICLSFCDSDPEIRSNVFKSLLLNTLSLTSIYTFDLLLQPLVQDQQKWFHRNFGWFYQILWLLPVVGASFYLNVCDVILDTIGRIANN